MLEAPFTSAVDVGARHYSFMPVRLFMKDRLRSDLRASKITAPVLVIHGENDAIVPITLGERLYALIQAPKRFVRVAGAGSRREGGSGGETVHRRYSGMGSTEPRLQLIFSLRPRLNRTDKPARTLLG